MRDTLKLARVQILILVLFIVSKSWLRPFVLKRNLHEVLDIIVLSLPNLYEGIVGVLSLTYIGLYLKNRLLTKTEISDSHTYVIATLLSAIFVLTQEFKIHNLGGNNVYDPYDVLFSIIGLSIGYIIVYNMQPTAEN